MCCFCYEIHKWLDIVVFLDKDDTPQAPSPAFSLYWFTGNVKEPTHLSLRVRKVAPGVLVLLCFQIWELSQVFLSKKLTAQFSLANKNPPQSVVNFHELMDVALWTEILPLLLLCMLTVSLYDVVYILLAALCVLNIEVEVSSYEILS